MKESILDVLMHLFEHYFEDEVVLGSDQDYLKGELAREGFAESSIDRAFLWLEGLAAQDEGGAAVSVAPCRSMRLYTTEELGKLDVECRGFLLFLEQIGVLDSSNRELVIEQVMALDSEEIDLEQVKWVVQMVLFNQPGKEEAFTWMEELVFDQAGGQLH